MYARAKERYCTPNPNPPTRLTLQHVCACQGTLFPPHPNPPTRLTLQHVCACQGTLLPPPPQPPYASNIATACQGTLLPPPPQPPHASNIATCMRVPRNVIAPAPPQPPKQKKTKKIWKTAFRGVEMLKNYKNCAPAVMPDTWKRKSSVSSRGLLRPPSQLLVI